MITALSLVRNSCRGALWKTLQSRPQTLGNSLHNQVLQNKALTNRSQQIALLSTSQCMNAAVHDHNHSWLWTAERALSASLIGLLPLGVMFPNPVLDYALALSLTVHVHWGMEAIVVDYARPSVVGATMSKAALASVYVVTAITLGGLFYFNYTDVGLCQAIRMLWKL